MNRNPDNSALWRFFFGSPTRIVVTVTVFVILVVTHVLASFINLVFTEVVLPIVIGVMLTAIALNLLPGRRGNKH